MKIPAAFLGLALVTGAMQAQAPVASKPADVTIPAPVAPADAKPDPKAKVDPKAKPDPKKKKEEPMGVIKGTEIKRANGTYLGLQVINNNFVLTFYDKKKKPAAMDVTRAAARWPNPRLPATTAPSSMAAGRHWWAASPCCRHTCSMSTSPCSRAKGMTPRRWRVLWCNIAADRAGI